MHGGLIGRINAALIWLAAIGYAAVFIKIGAQGAFGQDAHAYWEAIQGGPLYEGRPTELDAYLYSPLFAQAIAPLEWMPWRGFQAVWLTGGIIAAIWLVRPLPTRWAVPALLACVPDLVIGNIYTFLAAMVALGVRHSGAWLFGVLTKVTPGIGLVWLVARREWRQVGVAAAVGMVLVGVSWLVAPGAWSDWVHLLTASNSGDPTLGPRCAVALVLAIAARERPELIAVAVVVATPVFNAVACLVPLVAIARIRQSEVTAASSTTRLVPLARGPIAAGTTR